MASRGVWGIVACATCLACVAGCSEDSEDDWPDCELGYSVDRTSTEIYLKSSAIVATGDCEHPRCDNGGGTCFGCFTSATPVCVLTFTDEHGSCTVEVKPEPGKVADFELSLDQGALTCLVRYFDKPPPGV